MTRSRLLIAVVACALALAACGDDSAGTTEATGATTTTAPATTTTAAAQTTTTAAPTTTEAPTTTLAPDAHPLTGTPWSEVLPGEEESGTYRVDDFGILGDFEARVEYGVEFRGQPADRFVVGSTEGGSDGLAFYFDLSDPWKVTFLGLEAYSPGEAGGPEVVEYFTEPPTFDLTLPPGETQTITGEVNSQFGSGTFTNAIVVDVTIRSHDEQVTTGAGTFDGVTIVDIVVGGDFMGGTDFPIEYAVHPDNLLLQATLRGSSVELIGAWG